MFNILNVCGDYILGNILDIVRRAINLMGIIVPILLLIGATITFSKLVINPDEKDKSGNSAVKKIANSIVSAVVFFLLPIIINTTMSIIDMSNNSGGNDVGIIENGKKEVFSVSACWNSIKTTDITVKPNYKSTYELVNETIDKESENSNYSATYNSAVKITKELVENAKKNQSNNNSNESSTTSTNSNQTYKKVVIVGDSRFVWLSTDGPKDSRVEYIAKGSQGIAYLKQQINNIKSKDSSDTAFVINLGVNDLIYDNTTIANQYISYINNMAKEMKGKIYFLSVNPIVEDKAKANGYNTSWANNTNVNNFNTKLKNGLDSKITFLDSNSYLKANNFNTFDGIHYDQPTYLKIRTFILNNVKLA